MRPQLVMFLGLIFAAGTLISLTFGGNWVGDTEVDITNTLTVFKEATIAGIWTVSIPNIDFFFSGMKALMMMDFAFFTYYSGLQLVQWFFLLIIVVGVLWGLYTVIISIVQSALGGR